MQKFYEAAVQSSSSLLSNKNIASSDIHSQSMLLTADPGSTTREFCGFRIEFRENPYRVGSMYISFGIDQMKSRDDNTVIVFRIKSANIQRFSVETLSLFRCLKIEENRFDGRKFRVVIEQVDSGESGNDSCNVTGTNMSVITLFHHRHFAHDTYHLCQSTSFNSAKFGYLHETNSYNWKNCPVSQLNVQPRRAANAGPIRQVVESNMVVFVVPDLSQSFHEHYNWMGDDTRINLTSCKQSADQKFNTKWYRAAVWLTNQMIAMGDSRAEIMFDTDEALENLLDMRKCASSHNSLYCNSSSHQPVNLIFLGDTNVNSALRRLSGNNQTKVHSTQFPVRFKKRRCISCEWQFSLGSNQAKSLNISTSLNPLTTSFTALMAHSQIGLVTVLPLPDVRSIGLVIAGADTDAFWAAISLALPTIPPMARLPFTNMLPDWIIIDAKLLRYKNIRTSFHITWSFFYLC